MSERKKQIRKLGKREGVKFTMNLTPEVSELIVNYSKDTGMPMSRVVNNIVKEYFQKGHK